MAKNVDAKKKFFVFDRDNYEFIASTSGYASEEAAVKAAQKCLLDEDIENATFEIWERKRVFRARPPKKEIIIEEVK